MAKNIIVQDDYYRANHMSGVTRLRTELEEGGVCYWVPEDEAVNLTEKTVTENGTYAAMDDDANGYSTVVVNVPNVFGEHDEGRVVKSGALVDQSSRTVTVNGTYDTTTNNNVTVSVPNTYTQSDEGKVVNNSELVSQSSRTITVNGTYDTTTNNSVTVETTSNLSTKTITVNGTYQASSDNVDGYSDVIVSVPNTYTQSDEGKVVNNSALVSQSSRTITVNGTYDTTTNNSVTVETTSNLSTKTITVNGTYQASSDNVDGYSDVIVSVPNTYTQSDEGKVVNNSALVSQSSRTITVNGTYDTTTNNSVTVETTSNLSTKIITVNGTYQASSDNVDGYSDVIVSVPNTYTQSDEGKVVNNSALVSQSSRTITVNGTYDTTTNNSVTVETTSNLSTKIITVNGTYQASSDNVDGYSDVIVSVPNTYTQSDEGKVVNNSELVSQSSRTISVNGTYDTTTNNNVTVSVPNTYTQSDEGKVVNNSELVSQSSRTISVNGTYDTTLNDSVTVETTSNLSTKTITINGTYQASSDNVDGYSDVTVSVPNTYTQSDEGKVVNNSELVSQSSRTISVNGTYDTTLNDSVTVETTSNLSTKTITVNGTYQASSDNVDGYSDVTVSVPNTYTQSDEGKVVNNSELVSQSSRTISVNGTYDTTLNDSVTVETTSNLSTKTITVNGTYQASSDNVDGYSDVTVSVPNTYTQSDEGKVVNNSELVSQSSRTISVNGTYDTTLNDSVTVETTSNLSTKTITVNGTYQASSDNVDGYSDVTVSVPNTYTQSDEGKVVNNSELVSQSSRTISVNGTYDTTLNDSVTVETTSNLSTKTITINGTYQASSDNVDGYSDVTVSVPNTYTQSDQMKVVYAQSLRSQTSFRIIENGYYNTTFYNAVEVNVGGYVFSSTTISHNGVYEASDYGCDAFSKVKVMIPLGSGHFSENGIYEARDYDCDGFGGIEINVQPDLIDKTFNENGTYNARDYGHEGFSTITVSVETGELTSGYFDHNGTYYAADYNSPGFSIVAVSVPAIDISVIDRTIAYYSNNEIYTVGKYAFAGCEYLTSLTLAGCMAIESSAFYGCQSLTSLCLLYSYNCVALYEDPFSNSNIPMIYVNKDLVSDYKNDHYWGLYSDYIMPYEEENET